MKEILRSFEGKEIFLNAFNEIIAIDNMENEELIYKNGKYCIEQYFEGRSVPVHSPDGDPQKETTEKVSGRRYVKLMFNGDHDLALEAILEEI